MAVKAEALRRVKTIFEAQTAHSRRTARRVRTVMKCNKARVYGESHDDLFANLVRHQAIRI
jgi:hypothetical protein